MSLYYTLRIQEYLDSALIDGQQVVSLFSNYEQVTASTWHVEGDKGKTDFVRITIPGYNGKITGGIAPTLGIIGRLGGIGARPNQLGLVSDADGAIAALAMALKLAEMQQKGDQLAGDVIVTTHICPFAPIRPHHPVPFMDSPVDSVMMNQHDKIAEADAILSVDTTKGNRILNHKGVAITPTVKEGYILRVAEDLLTILAISTGIHPAVLPLATQDITPYNNGVHHINSILQPATSTAAPVVGVAICTETAVPGCATGASHEVDIATAVRFMIEVAKAYTSNLCCFYDEQEFAELVRRYGSLTHLQTAGHLA